MKLRVVFDTNTVVSALLFTKGRLAWLRPVWRQGSVVPLVTKATTEELLRVLAYPKFQFAQDEREELLGEFLPFVEIVDVPSLTDDLPRCRDPQDQKFLQLAAAGEADALVTGDADLLMLSDEFPIPIMTPADFRNRMALKDND